MPPAVRYARNGQLRVAYQVVGHREPDLVWALENHTQLDLHWELPYRVREFEDFSQFARLLVFDKRGIGLSDSPTVLTYEDRAEDIRAVMDAAESKAAHVLGVYDGADAAALFAATHPERTRSLIIYGERARQLRDVDYEFGATRESHLEWVDYVEREFFHPIDPTAPSETWKRYVGAGVANDPAFWEWFERVRRSTSPANRLAHLRLSGTRDIRAILPSIRVPTLVLVREKDPSCPLEAARDLASRIPGAKFVVLPGEGHFWFDIWPDVRTQIQEWVTGTAGAPGGGGRSLTTLAFTDIVDSTKRLDSMGDAAWRSLVANYYRVARRHLAAYSGEEVDAAGDGLFAHFDGPSRAVRYCLAVIREARQLGLDIRAGAHTGEVERDGRALRGINVVIAARLGQMAAAGEVLVSQTVRDLSAGSGLAFEQRGSALLKGLAAPLETYAAQAPGIRDQAIAGV